MMKCRLAVICAVLLCAGTAAAAQKKKAKGDAAKPPPPAPPACGLTWFPLQVGNSWTWKSGDLQTTLRVVAVSDGGKDEAGLAITKIDVEEDTPGGKVATSWTCTEKGLRIDPLSFAFAGEAGVLHGMAFATKERTGLSFAPDTSFLNNSGWQEKIVIDVTRTDTAGQGADLPPAQLTLDKSVIVHEQEDVASPIVDGMVKAQYVTFELRASVMIEGLEKPSQLPVKRFAGKDAAGNEVKPPGIWMIKGVGIVRIQDSYDKDWTLTNTTMTMPAAQPPAPAPAPPK